MKDSHLTSGPLADQWKDPVSYTDSVSLLNQSGGRSRPIFLITIASRDHNSHFTSAAHPPESAAFGPASFFFRLDRNDAKPATPLRENSAAHFSEIMAICVCFL